MVGPLAPSPLAYLIHNHDAKVQGELLQHELQHGCTLCMAKGTLAKVPATDANHRVLPKVLPELGHHLVQHASVSDSCLRAESACADGAVEIMQYSLVLQHGGGGGGASVPLGGGGLEGEEKGGGGGGGGGGAGATYLHVRAQVFHKTWYTARHLHWTRC